MSSDQTKPPTYLSACVQFNLDRGKVEPNLKRAEAGVRKAAEKGAQLMVLPELWTTSLVPEPSVKLIRESRDAERAMVRLSKELGVMIIGGGLLEEKGSLYNHCQVVDRGKVLGSYRKIHMFSVSGENKIMTPGDKPLVLSTRLGRIGVVICYDIRFPELVRHYFEQHVEVLAVPAQWPEARSGHWRTLLQARAIENQMFVLGCNRTGSETSLKNKDTLIFPGDSRVIDPMGEVIASAVGEEEPLLAELELRRVETMRRIMPIRRDRQIETYRKLWSRAWEAEPAPSQGPQ